MRNFRTLLIFLVTIGSAALPGFAGTNGADQFEKLKSLAGVWQGTMASGGTPVSISFKIVSGGTAVMETSDEGKGGEMVTLYHLDGGRVMMTHYCASNNQPRMQAGPSNGKANAIDFSFVDVTNLASPDAGHMNALSIVWNDPNHVTERWTWLDHGKSKVESFELRRQK